MATNSSAGGKGSGARPMEISRDQFANNFDAIFRKHKELRLAAKEEAKKEFQTGEKPETSDKVDSHGL